MIFNQIQMQQWLCSVTHTTVAKSLQLFKLQPWIGQHIPQIKMQ